MSTDDALLPSAPEASVRREVPVLPTTVVGSYSVPHWLERLKTDYHRGQISAAQLEAVHDVAIKAAVKDQEIAGIDIVSDGELRRDNDVDHVISRLPGITITDPDKAFYYDYHHAVVTGPVAADGVATLGLAQQYAFTRALTQQPITVSLTSPFALSCRLTDEFFHDRHKLVHALAHALNSEAHALAAAGATRLQIDEPYLAGHPEYVDLAIEGINLVTEGVDVHWAMHVCYGNRYARPSWEGHYDFLFPAVHAARIDRLTLEFARKGYDDLRLIARSGWDRELGLGVIDVKSREVESDQLVASRIRRTLDLLPPEQVVINPDCGLRHLPSEVAQAKLRAMVRATRSVRDELSPPIPSTVDVTATQEN